MDAVYIVLYVDDLFIVGMKLINIESVKKGLCAEFKMKDLGEAKFLLGIEIRRQENGDVLLVQEQYARDVIRRFNMEDCKPVTTTLEFGCRLFLGSDNYSTEGRDGRCSIQIGYRESHVLGDGHQARHFSCSIGTEQV